MSQRRLDRAAFPYRPAERGARSCPFFRACPSQPTASQATKERMNQAICYLREGPVAIVSMDDGKVNSLTVEKIAALRDALDQAEKDQAVVLLKGRDQRFSGGFDLKTIQQGGALAGQLLQDGFALLERILTFPMPVVIGCTGHALAMGAFLLLSADIRIGSAGSFKIGANEVAIGMTLPHVAVELCRARLAPNYMRRATLCAEIYTPEEAVAAGFLDRVVPVDALHATALETAKGLAQLNLAAYRATKARLQAPTLNMLHEAMTADAASWNVMTR